MNFYNQIYKDKIYNITYEDLVNNFDTNVKKLISYLNLEWDKTVFVFMKVIGIFQQLPFLIKERIFLIVQMNGRNIKIS